jgi:hypothetical protein
VLISLLSLFNAKIALYPAVALFFLALAMLVRKPWLKIFFWVLSPHFMFRLIFSEGFFFMERSAALNSTQPICMYAVLNIFCILFFALWSFPFLLGFAAVYFDCDSDLLWLKKWKLRTGLIIIAGAFLSCTLILALIPSYSNEWRQTVIIDQLLDLNSGKGKVLLRSSEYLRHLKVTIAGKDTNISTWDRELILKEFTYDRTPWINVERTITTFIDSSTTYDLLVKLHFKYRPEDLIISYSAGGKNLYDIAGEFISSRTEHSVSMRWKSLPDTVMMIPIHFRVDKADSVTENIEAKFLEMVEPVQIKKELCNISTQTTLHRMEVIHGADKK